VFLLRDAATGQPRPVSPAQPGELRIWVPAPATAEAGLRRYLLADMLRRVAERHHLLVTTWYQAAGAGIASLAELNVYPAELAAAPPYPPDVTITRLAANPQPAGPQPSATQPATPQPSDPAPGTGSASFLLQPGELTTAALDGLDPLALRLALLERPYREPVTLARDTLEAADGTLRHWRGLVAGWANSPSKAMCAQYTGDVQAALDDDLDTPAALRTMHALAGDDTLPPGSRFEAFAHLDRLLGLDLAREVGR
jgi:hypothetical protein